ncbi:TetR/AcrR family transcriptional regulator [Rhizobium sp.]|jgi:TetR/AcrR family transcriptional regulator, mexJK operon transcriptional repressor|uniref:TetR/AcrR family transcriptional regulator n=1 Tax=Rhizobium sp. TaxID=391 RepID=UPI000E9A6922|nr:TetR family transcriptional regulator [Rhizobium sp.]
MRVKSQKKRNEIIAVAGALFRSHGYGALSMALIAAEVGGSKGTLYGYFPSKEELFTAFVLSAGQQRWEEFNSVADRSDGIENTLKDLGLRYLRFLLSDEIMSVNRLVIAEAARFPELGRIIHENGVKNVIGVFAETLERAANAGELTIPDPIAAAWKFKALCEARLFEEYLWAIRNSVTEQEIIDNIEPACAIFLDHFHAG